MSTETPPDGWRPGHRVGAWIVDRVLDRGVSGTVLLCHDEGAPLELVHVKICDLPDGEARKRFAAEAALLCKLEHPGIVPVRESHLKDNPPWLVLDPGHGEDLQAILDRDGALPVGRALQVAEGIAHVLSSLHADARFHRDLKPRSILVDGDGVKITDFGIARQEGSPHLTAPDVVLGTVDYAPPEWTDRDDERPAARDLYGLGVVLHEMLTGALAYQVAGRPGTLDRAVKVIGRKRSEDHLDPGEPVPEPVRALVRELTAQDPSDRPTTAREVGYRLGTLRTELSSDELDLRLLPRPRPSPASEAPTLVPPSATPTVPPAVRRVAPAPVGHAVPGPQPLPRQALVAGVVIGGLAVGGGIGAVMLALWVLLVQG